MRAAQVEDKYEWILQGFQEGFDIGINKECISSGATDMFPGSTKGVIKLGANLSSAKKWPEVVSKKLQEELATGRITGPTLEPPFKNCVISPIGVVPKKEQGKFRMIHHLSYPKGNSVNEAIAKEEKTVFYPSVDDAIEVILKSGDNVWLAKTDIKSAFRIVPVHPDHYSALGICWQGKYYFDRCLPMGCATSCKIFTGISDCLVDLFNRTSGKCECINVLDDFLFIGKNKEKTGQALADFLAMCNKIGVPIAKEKTEGPYQKITFLGIEIDAADQEVRLPNEKLVQYVPCLEKTMKRNKAKCQELQSLAGKLQFACYVVPQGRAFLRRLYDVFGGWETSLKPYHHIRITREVKRDMEMWLIFFKQFNGRCMFKRESQPDKHLITDASGSIGFGLIFGSKWAYGPWPIEWESLGIVFKEMFPIALVVCKWPMRLENSILKCESDNMAVVHTINSFSCKCADTMVLVRKMALTCLRFNIRIYAIHVPGVQNVLADALSRLQLERFHAEANRTGKTLASRPELIEPLWLDLDNWRLGSYSPVRRGPTGELGYNSSNLW